MAWYDEAVFYHIYPLGLLDAPKENSYESPVHRFDKLSEWIPHIKEIGCNAIYIGPLFESVGHGYETTDYRKLDSRLGDNNDLKKFVKECHKQGVRVIFDGVFNHVGRDFFAFKDVKEKREASKYCGWFLNLNFYGNNEYNDGFCYENWGGYNLLVKLNQRNPEVKDYICDVIRYWVSEFDVDGIRLDAADVLDFDYMKALRAVANEVKPDFWLMGEVIHGDYTRWVNGETLHSVTNYVLHKALFSGHNDHNYFEIAHTVKRLNDMGGNRPEGLKLYNFVDNHDVERIVNKLNNRENYVPVHILMYTLPGIPSVYYGSEFGIEGKKERGSDASLRPAINLGEYKDAVKNNSYTKLISRLGRVRQSCKTLSYGAFNEIMLTNRQYAFTRSLDDSMVIVAVNNDENTATVYGRGLRDGEYIGVISGINVTVNGGEFRADIPANSGEIWLPKSEADKVDIPVKTTPIKINYMKTTAINSEKNTSEKKSESVVVEREKNDVEKREKPEKVKNAKKCGMIKNGAGDKYSLEEKYNSIDVDEIKNRNDYDNMSIEELQVAILEKMASNGPVNEQMIKTVMDNIYLDSLRNWVKSFR